MFLSLLSLTLATKNSISYYKEILTKHGLKERGKCRMLFVPDKYNGHILRVF